MNAIFLCAALIGFQNPGHKGQDVDRAIVAANRGRVTASYLRVHAPETVLGLVRQVKAGRMNRAALNGLLGPRSIQALLASNIDRVKLAPRRSAKGTGAQLKPGSIKRRDHSPWAMAAASTGLLNKLAVDYFPAELAFPPLYEGERAELMVHLISKTDGPVTASIPKNKNFKIREMRVYDGTVSEKALGKVGGGGVPVAATRTSEPWIMDASAGQSVGIVVRFEPDFNFINNGAGSKTTTLALGGKHWNTTQPKQPSWKVDVPVKGRFKGINLGVISFAEQSEIDVIIPNSYDPKVSHSLKAPIVLINSKTATSGTIRPIKLPAGVKMSPYNVTIGDKETKTIQVPLRMDRDSSSIWFHPETPYEIVLEATFGARKSQIGFYVIVYPSYHMWSFNDVDVGSCTVAGDFMLRGNGEFNFFALADNHDLVVGREVHFRGGFDGSDSHINMVISVSNNDVETNSYGFFRQAFKDYYTSYIYKPLPIKVTVKYP